jgi:hypothetical protein
VVFPETSTWTGRSTNALNRGSVFRESRSAHSRHRVVADTLPVRKAARLLCDRVADDLLHRAALPCDLTWIRDDHGGQPTVMQQDADLPDRAHPARRTARHGVGAVPSPAPERTPDARATSTGGLPGQA